MEEGVQHHCWSVSTDVKLFSVFFFFFFLSWERDGITTLSDCCFLFLGPPGGSSKLTAFSKSSQASLPYTTKMGPSLPHPDPFQDCWGCPKESSLVFIFSSIYTERIIPLEDRDIWKYLLWLSDNINKIEQNEPRSKKPYPLPFALH